MKKLLWLLLGVFVLVGCTKKIVPVVTEPEVVVQPEIIVGDDDFFHISYEDWHTIGLIPIFFDFDKYDLREDTLASLYLNILHLKSTPIFECNGKLTVSTI